MSDLDTIEFHLQSLSSMTLAWVIFGMNIMQKLVAGSPKMPRLFLAFAPSNMPVVIVVSVVQWLLRKLSSLTYIGNFDILT